MNFSRILSCLTYFSLIRIFYIKPLLSNNYIYITTNYINMTKILRQYLKKNDMQLFVNIRNIIGDPM